MPELVYSLCAATSLVCAWVLFRAYKQSQSGLLLWTALCFAFLAANNLLLVTDLVIMPDVDLRPLRAATGLAGPLVLLGGLIWEST